MGMIINPYRFAVVNTPPTCLNTNTVAWYIADDLTTITKDGNNLVSSWKDKLGSGHDLIQATGTKQPLWSNDGITFDGSDDYLKTDPFTYNQPETIYLVINPLNSEGSNYFLSSNGINPRAKESGIDVLILNGGAFSGNYIYTNNTLAILRICFNGASSKFIYMNNTPNTGNWGTENPGGITFGALSNGTVSCNFILKEAIFRSVAESSADETEIYNYLATKYGFATI